MTTTTILLILAVWGMLAIIAALIIGRAIRNADRRDEAERRADIDAAIERALRRILDDDEPDADA